jgi:hypothetical protein
LPYTFITTSDIYLNPNYLPNEKMLLALAVLICTAYDSNAQNTFCWIGAIGATGTGPSTTVTNWNVATNWAQYDPLTGVYNTSINRSKPAAKDILYIDGNALIAKNGAGKNTTYINNLTKDECASLIIRNSANVYFISHI